MSPQQAPGSWTVDAFGLDIENACNCLRKGHGTEGEWTAVAVSFGPEDPDGEGQDHVAYCHPDNAALIAAAPDLLVALKMAVSALEDNDIDESMAGEFEILTDAIAKAEGREVDLPPSPKPTGFVDAMRVADDYADDVKAGNVRPDPDQPGYWLHTYCDQSFSSESDAVEDWRNTRDAFKET